MDVLNPLEKNPGGNDRKKDTNRVYSEAFLVTNNFSLIQYNNEILCFQKCFYASTY